ncbi:MAG: T9SS type A sorting domain-containing protein [Aliifodinibius sp.]|nr:T9SS type A sorting domain-containing protein [Fodinibius sp.]NIV10293.1 T9SS type A sorting domain-containing protein [Fodinibius sp.]NIY23932.1 T9SS type A sorting domain-containing protein [Fodinibius sp.]
MKTAPDITYVKRKSEPIIPQTTILWQNYPNPFNPKTSIRYSIRSNLDVSIKVYDLLGKEIATLVNEKKPAGAYTVEFDASKLSSGIYFYQLQAGDFIETKKMILMR